MLRSAFLSSCYMAALVAAMSFNSPDGKNGKATLHILFENYVGNQPLQIDNGQYKNDLGQSYTVSMLKYYISNIQLVKADQNKVNFDDYFLVNEEEKGSKNIGLNTVPEGEYTAISFILGVDSLHNCSGAQSGALDPINGMFWAWNTGYIFLKMEGQSPVSTQSRHMLEFHIGGYKAPNNCIRNFTLKFKKPLIITAGKNASIEIKTDLEELFKTPTVIDFSKTSSVTDFHNAATIADNYKDMFTTPQ